MKPDKLTEIVMLNIRARRLELDLTQQQLADKMGCKQGVVAKIERGISGISMEMLAELSEALQTTPATLVTEGAFSLVSA